MKLKVELIAMLNYNSMNWSYFRVLQDASMLALQTDR